MSNRIVSPEKAKELKITLDIFHGLDKVKIYDEDELRIYDEQLDSRDHIIYNCSEYGYDPTPIWEMMKREEFTYEEIDEEIEEAFFWQDRSEEWFQFFLKMSALRLKKLKHLKMFEEKFNEDMSTFRFYEDIDEAIAFEKSELVRGIDNYLIYSGKSVEEIFDYINNEYHNVNIKILV